MMKATIGTHSIPLLKLALVTVTLSAVTLLAGCNARGQDSEPAPPPAVDVAQVLEEEVTLWDDFTGRLAAPETVELRPRVSGYIEQVNFQEGALVERGDTLFVIDQRPYQARERAARAELEQRRSQLALAQSEAQRAERLLAERAISREEHDQRQAAFSSAKAAVNSAEAALESAQLELHYTEVKAPISGRIGRAHITEGNLAAADNTLLTTLVSVDPLYVYFDSNEEASRTSLAAAEINGAPHIRVGLAGEQGYPHSGQVDFIDNHLNADTGTLQLRARLPNPNGQLRPGQFARILMPIENLKQALMVDEKAVLTDQDRRFVYVVDEQNRTSRRQVVPGRRAGELLVIREGLQAGERIVVNGLQKVRASGMEITPQLVDMRRTGEALAATH